MAFKARIEETQTFQLVNWKSFFSVAEYQEF